jgi:5'-deoxynucleotidase YfbR-like HD superfamily hydrolase
MNNVEKAYIITFTGKKFNLLEPTLAMIDIRDIAHSQAMNCRWTGHCKYHYSIAQHAYYCSFIGPEFEALERLMHDSSESYIGDMNRPLKHYTDAGAAYRKVEHPLQSLIYNAFGMSEIEPPSVKIADEGMLYAELEQLLPSAEFKFTNNPFGNSKAAKIVIEEWTPAYAEKKFLERFNHLYKGRIN